MPFSILLLIWKISTNWRPSWMQFLRIHWRLGISSIDLGIFNRSSMRKIWFSFFIKVILVSRPGFLKILIFIEILIVSWILLFLIVLFHLLRYIDSFVFLFWRTVIILIHFLAERRGGWVLRNRIIKFKHLNILLNNINVLVEC